MKILFVAVFNPNSTNYEQANCLEKLGHEVIRYDYRKEIENKTLSDRDKDLHSLCCAIEPNLVIFSKCNGINYRVIEECNQICPTCLWYMDPLNQNWNNELLDKISRVTYCVMDKRATYKLCLKYNKNTFFVTDGYDENIDVPYIVEQNIDVGFIGSLYDMNRQTIVKELKKIHEINVTITGGVYREEHAKTVSRTKINLNLCTTKTASNRIYKIMASGGFLLTDTWDGYEERFEDGKDLVIFNSVEELAEKVKYYLFHIYERNEIAANGHETILPYSKLGWAKKIIEAYNDTIS